MIVVTHDEQAELVEHFEERSDIWVLHNGVWVRLLCALDVEDREYALAIKIAPHVEPNLYAVTFKPVAYTPAGAEQYTLWLLRRFTAYGERMQVLELLRKFGVKEHNLHAASRDVCALRQGTFVSKRERRSNGQAAGSNHSAAEATT